MVLDSGRTIRDVGRELGVNHDTLRNWTDKLRQERQTAAAGTAAGSALTSGPSCCGCLGRSRSWNSRRRS
ncbi:transposase [Catellatospora sp. NEAU-YM18]|nr:transposase [Catellatospora tritici]